MSNISNLLIKDSFNYVLQSDLSTGIVYRIGGAVAVNPIFSSGLTINDSFIYQDGSEVDGYVLSWDSILGKSTWKPVSGGTSGTIVTGGTFNYTANTLTLNNSNGTSVVINGLQDVYVTGGTVQGTNVSFNYNNGNTFFISGITPYSLFDGFTASTQNDLAQKLNKSGDTMSGQLNLPTISATTYLNLPVDNDKYITSFSYNDTNNTFTILDNSGGTFNSSINVVSGLTATGDITAFTYFGDGSNLTGIPKAGGGSGGQIYYLNISNTQDGYYEFSFTPTSGVQQIISATTGSTQTAYIGGFLTPSNIPNLTQLPIGVIGFYLHARTDSVGSTFNIYVELYKKSSGGSETLLLTTEPVPVASTTIQMYISDSYFSGATLDLTDRLLVKVYATNTGSQSETIYLYSEDGSTYSFGVTTIPSYVDTYTTGLTYSNNVLTLEQNQGKLPLTANIISYKFYYQNTTPTGTGTSSIDEGAIWEHSDTGIQYVYVYDGDSYQWIQQTLPQGTGPIGPTGPNNISTGTTTDINGILKGNGSNVSVATPNVDYQSALGYTAENVSNKETVALDNSTTKYPNNYVVNTSLQSFSDDVDYAIMTNQRILFNF